MYEMTYMSHGSRGEYPTQTGQEQHGEGKHTIFGPDPKKIRNIVK